MAGSSTSSAIFVEQSDPWCNGRLTAETNIKGATGGLAIERTRKSE